MDVPEGFNEKLYESYIKMYPNLTLEDYEIYKQNYVKE